MHRGIMNAPRSLRVGLSALALGLLASTAACTADSSDAEDPAGDEEDLTSVTARSRTLTFVGTVYVAANADDATIMSTVRTQAQTAFGPLRTSDIAVNSRELKEIDASTFVKRPVKVIDPSVANDPGRDMLEVKYTYKDNAVVDVRYARRTAVPLALMSPGYRSQLDRILQECTPNDEHSREFLSSAWYVFEPRLPQCQEAMRKEQQKIDADRAKLTDPRSQVAKSDVDRLYLPIQAKLGADKTNKGKSYPDYHRLYRGGVQPNKLVISLVYGNIDHDNNGGPSGDFNWGELMTTLSEVMDAGGELKLVAGPNTQADLSSFTLASGKKVQNPSFKDLVKLHGGGDSLGLSYSDKRDLEKQFAERIFKKWLTVERQVKVKIGDEAPRDFGVQFLVYFGADSDSRPHKFATKNSDVFLYNGHSYIGFGPLDPRNFTKDDFADGYQILWIDGCVSYNYYEKDYIPLKTNGTKDLDLITNGIEAPSWRSGHAMGQFLVTLLNGNGASYRDLLLAAQDTEALRVVDGELDNTYSPSRYPITVTPR
jgi:hypothetical protein